MEGPLPLRPELELYTCAELIAELAARETWVGVIIWSEREHRTQGPELHPFWTFASPVATEDLIPVLETILERMKRGDYGRHEIP